MDIFYLFRDIPMKAKDDWEYRQFMRMVALVYDQITLRTGVISKAKLRDE